MVEGLLIVADWDMGNYSMMSKFIEENPIRRIYNESISKELDNPSSLDRGLGVGNKVLIKECGPAVISKAKEIGDKIEGANICMLSSNYDASELHAHASYYSFR